MSGEGLLRINLQDLEEEEEDEDYVPQASEIEEYKREKKELKDLKKQKAQEELHLDVLRSWKELKNEVKEKEMNQVSEIKKQTQSLLKDKELLRQIAQRALRLNEDDKQRKVIFAGQEFVVDSSGEIVGRADEQAHLKEFQLFDSKEISKMKFEQPKTVKEEIVEESKQENKPEEQEIIIEENEKKEDEDQQQPQQQQQEQEQTQQQEQQVIPEEKAQVVEEVVQLTQEEKHRLDMKNRFEYLQKVMEKINSKSKSITSIHKSKLDWKSFTKKEKLEKKFEQNRKAGYLDKQNFIAKAHEKQKQIQKSSRR